jgi:hypothetical protein
MSEKITAMTELVSGDSFTWFECVDLNETDPLLQNKKMKYDNIYDSNAHVQNTDQYLDFGGANQISAGTLVGMLSMAHDQNTDIMLDEFGANKVTAADAADAVAKKHVQNTDTFLDSGGQYSVSAQNIAFLVNTVQPFYWLHAGDALSTGFMHISTDNAGQRAVDLNYSNTYNINMSALLLDLVVGRWIVITFDGGYYIGSINTTPIDFTTFVRLVITTMVTDDNFSGIGQLTII